jgi:hypothetical protein
MTTTQAILRCVFGSMFAAVSLLSLPADGRADEEFGDRVAGTYFVEQSSGSFRVITLDRNGGLSAIDSSQGRSLIKEGAVEFTGQLGSWQQNGAQDLVATVINFGLGTDTKVGTTVATYEMRFGGDFDNVKGAITLLFFAPGVNPFADGAKPMQRPVEITLEGIRV